jgi:hypothetical protein
MVRIKHTTHPINIRVSFETKSMASNEAWEVTTSQKEGSPEVTSS